MRVDHLWRDSWTALSRPLSTLTGGVRGQWLGPSRNGSKGSGVWKLSMLGTHLARMPVDVRLARMLVYAAVLGCNPDCVVKFWVHYHEDFTTDLTTRNTQARVFLYAAVLGCTPVYVVKLWLHYRKLCPRRLYNRFYYLEYTSMHACVRRCAQVHPCLCSKIVGSLPKVMSTKTLLQMLLPGMHKHACLCTPLCSGAPPSCT